MAINLINKEQLIHKLFPYNPPDGEKKTYSINAYAVQKAIDGCVTIDDAKNFISEEANRVKALIGGEKVKGELATRYSEGYVDGMYRAVAIMDICLNDEGGDK